MIEERFEKRLSSWKGKHLSIGGRLTLINSVLSSLPMYMMSFFEIPKGVLKKLDYFRSRFYWQGDGSRRKYRLAKWNTLCQPKVQGGLGIQDLRIKNIALLSKWLFKLLTSEGTWQQLLRNKYLGSQPLVQADWKPGDSHFWSSLMKVKLEFLRFGTFKVNNGSQVWFFEDKWLGNRALKDQYPGLYNIVREKFMTIAEVMASEQPNISWRRSLFGPKLVAWRELLSRLDHINLVDEDDEFRWNLGQSGHFSVKSHYQALIHSDTPNLHKRLWRIKAPLKLKVFLWYLRRGVILTKDNLAKRHWQNKTCCFCHKSETIKHLFFECRLARMVWGLIHLAFGILRPSSVSNMFGNWLGGFDKTLRNIALLGAAVTVWSIWLHRNGIVFEKKTSSSPLQVIYSISHWLRTWAVLEKEDLQTTVVEASRSLVQVAKDFFSRAHG